MKSTIESQQRYQDLPQSPTKRWEKFIYEDDSSFTSTGLEPNPDGLFIVMNFDTNTHITLNSENEVTCSKDYGKPLKVGVEYLLVKPKY